MMSSKHIHTSHLQREHTLPSLPAPPCTYSLTPSCVRPWHSLGDGISELFSVESSFQVVVTGSNEYKLLRRPADDGDSKGQGGRENGIEQVQSVQAKEKGAERRVLNKNRACWGARQTNMVLQKLRS
jgi:hypothetical protein